MPLNPLTLQVGLLRAFQQVSRAGGSVASIFAGVYNEYALIASCAYGPFVPTGLERLRLEATLTPALVGMGGASAILGTAWGVGIQAYWAGAVFGTGVATVLPGVPVIIAQLTAVLSNASNTMAAAAALMAATMDVGTRTLVIGGPSGPVPVV